MLLNKKAANKCYRYYSVVWSDFTEEGQHGSLVIPLIQFLKSTDIVTGPPGALLFNRDQRSH